MIDDNNARCKKCGDIKSINNFQIGRKGKKYEYRFAYCNICRKQQTYLNLSNNINKFLSDRFNRLIRRAAKNNISCTITKEEFINQYHRQHGLCFYTDNMMIYKAGSDLHRDSLSIDKIIPEKGYVKNNVVFCTHRINTCKNDLSLDEIKQWMPSWYDRIRNFIGDF